MPTPSVRLAVAPAVMVLALTSGCGREESKPAAQPASPPVAKSAPAPQPAPPPAQPAVPAAPPVAAAPAPAAPPAAPAAAPVLASVQYSADPDLRCDLLEVKRVSGGALMIRWRLLNTAGQAGGLAAAQPKAIDYSVHSHLGDHYFTDPAENKKYGILRDSQHNMIADVHGGRYGAGQQRLSWAKFPAPPASSKKITVHIQGFQPIEDAPVAE